MKCVQRCLALVLLLLVLYPTASVSAQETEKRITMRIVGGVVAQPGTWPFMAALVLKGRSLYNGQFCGGTLIHKKWVVTAAHCVVDQTASQIAVALNVHNLLTDAGEVINVHRIIVHPNYSASTSDYDIALLELQTESSMTPIWIYTGASDLTGVSASVAGWGLTNPEDDDSYSAVLRQVSVPVVSNSVCQLSYGFDSITARMLCAGLAQGGKDSCQGDSGGPLVVTEGGSTKLAGIVSFGNGCAEAEYYGVYSRVSQLASFIVAYVPAPAPAQEPVPRTEPSLFGLWNGYLGMINVAELANNSDQPKVVSLDIYSMAGAYVSTRTITLPARTEQDEILNSYDGFQNDAYGVVRVRGDVAGRIFYYRTLGSAFDAFEYAFGVEFSPPLTGASAVGFNTYQPSENFGDAGNLVANWLSVVNLGTSAAEFTVKKYNQAGALLSTEGLSVASFERRDVDGGHQYPGPANVGLLEIIPVDGSTPYLAQLMRYGYGAGGTFDFAFPLSAKAGAAQAIAPLSTTNNAQNWLEVANASSSAAALQVRFYSQFGELLHTANLSLSAHAQEHLNARAILGAETIGYAEISGGAAVAQSMIYVRDASGRIQGMYGLQSRESSPAEATGSYNLYLGMQNYLQLFNADGDAVSVELTISSLSAPGSSRTVSLAPHSAAVFALQDYSAFGTLPDTYGTVLVQPNSGGAVLSQLVRMRYNASGLLEFAAPTQVTNAE